MIELLNMDCMDYMRECEDNAFDLAIVDPPYGIGVFTCDAHFPKAGHKVPNVKNYTDDYTWNDSIPEQRYFDEMRRVSNKQIIWGANYYNSFNPGGALIWYKGPMTETISHVEIASLSFQVKCDYVHIDWQSGFYRKKFGDQIHPCQKPVGLYDWVLHKYAEPGQKILDTHLGSGSSAIAAHYFGVDFVGIEIDAEYYDAACKRFEQETAQIDLFA